MTLGDTASIAASISAFLERHQRDIAWIIRDSQRLWERDDVESEAYVALLELRTPSGEQLDPAVEADAAQLLQHLRRIARRSGRVMRSTMRPDQAGSGEDWTPGIIGWDRITDADGTHPLSLLEAAESPDPEPPEFDPYHSELAAWHWLVQRFNRHTTKMAAFLMISPSWCRECRRRARRRATMQWPLPRSQPQPENGDASIRPWRRFKLPSRHDPKQHNQQPLDFWKRPPQPASGQMWLI